MRTARAIPVLLALLLVAVHPLPAAGQQDELTGTLRGTAAEKVAIAVPPTRVGAGATAALSAELSEVLRADLDFSGWFGLLDRLGEGRVAPDRLDDAGAWRAVGAAYLVDSEIDVEGGRGVLTVQLVETGSGEDLLHRRWFGALPRDTRRLAHAASDAIVLALTGRPGIAETRIAFVSRRGRAKEVYLMDYDGARVRRLTTTSTINLSPAWSPDGRRLAFLSYIRRQPSIYLLDENGKVTTLHPKGGELNAAPDFSPDGRQLAFSSDRDDNSELYTYEIATGVERRLTHHPAIDTAPCWSPSGRQIAFTSDRSGTPQIYITESDGSTTRRLTWEGSYNESAAWSPDGGRIAFVSRIAGRFEIVIHDLATGREQIITSGRGNKENPRWAPDGRHLVFAGNRDGEYAIYTIRDDGSDLRRLTRGTRAEMPDWSPLRR